MGKLKEYKYIILLAVIILGLAFYWFQVRPAQARKECAMTKNLSGYESPTPESLYVSCLRAKGLEK